MIRVHKANRLSCEVEGNISFTVWGADFSSKLFVTYGKIFVRSLPKQALGVKACRVRYPETDTITQHFIEHYINALLMKQTMMFLEGEKLGGEV